MRIVYLAKGARGAACLEHMIRGGYAPLAVAHVAQSIEPELAGLASQCSAAVLDGRCPRDAGFIQRVAAFEPDLVVMSGYNRLIGRELLSIPRHGVLNLHAGRLPNYRGASPINWQIINGETEGACTVVYVDEGLDTGPILDEARYPIGPDEDAGRVRQRTLELFPPLLVGVLDQFAAGDPPRGRPQDRSAGTWWAQRFADDGLIDWRSMTARQVHNLVRASADPYPNAFTFCEGRKLHILRTRLAPRDFRGAPGRVLGRENGMMLVACADRAVGVVDIRREDGAAESATEALPQFARLG